MKEMNLASITCFRCSHEWIPRVKKVIICPKCKSPYWDIKGRSNGKKNKKIMNKNKEKK